MNKIFINDRIFTRIFRTYMVIAVITAIMISIVSFALFSRNYNIRFIANYPVNAISIEESKEYITVSISESQFYNIISRQDDMTGSYLIMNNDGSILSQSHRKGTKELHLDEEIIHLYRERQRELRDMTGTFKTGKYVVSYISMDNGWTLFNTVPAMDYYGKSDRIWLNLILCMVVALVIGFILSDYFTLKLYKPLTYIDRKIKSIFNNKSGIYADISIGFENNEIFSEINAGIDHFQSTLQQNSSMKHVWLLPYSTTNTSYSFITGIFTVSMPSS